MKLSRLAAVSSVVSIASAVIAAFATHAEPAPQPAADAKGDIQVPADYRASYQALGSWAVAADKAPGSQGLHQVYASPGAIESYRKNGKFPDGAVLIKEVYDTATEKMTTGTVSRAQNLKGWFVMVKDSKNSHPESKLWGDGWGWSWFDAPNRTKTTSTDFKADCKGCHLPAKASDYVYVQGYPTLKAD